MAKTFKITLRGSLLDAVEELAANDGVTVSMAIVRVVLLWNLAGSNRPLPADLEILDDGLTLALDEGIRSYLRSVDAFARSQKILSELPAVLQATLPFVSLLSDLDVLGDAVSHLPGLIDEVRQGRRIGAKLLRQAEAHGLVFRYDRSGKTPAPQNDP